MANLPVYGVVYNTQEDGDLYAISIVDSPANQFDFVAMSEQKQVIKLAANDKKKILYGIVLRPDQQIYREFPDGTPFMLTFDAQTIERLSQDFMRKGYQNNSTYNHEANLKLEGTTVVENWIVKSDEGSSIGLPVQPGDWCIGMKLSDELWSEYIETGMAKGFSIDSFIKFEKLNMKNIELNNSNNPEGYKKEKTTMKDIFKKIVKLFNEEGVVNMDTQVSSIGELTADVWEVGNVVYAADGQPVLDAEFVIGDNTYQTDETGAITEISSTVEETQDQAMTETPVETEVETEVEVSLDTQTTSIGDLTADKWEVGGIVTDVNGPVGNATFDLNGKTFETDENGVITTVTDIIPVDAPAEIAMSELENEVLNLKETIEKLTKEQELVLTENTKLKEMVASTKLKAVVKGTNPIQLTNKEISAESTLDALSRIIKKTNK